jgi:hypothetical protein
MARNRILIVVAALMLASLACGLANGLLGNTASSGTVTDLWPDVPRMDGLTRTNLQIPLGMNLGIQAYLKAASQNQMSVDYIAFVSNKNPAAVSAYYTADRMTAAGWNSKDAPGCVNDTNAASSGGALCIFGKKASDNSGVMLAVITAVDPNTKQTQVYFARIALKNVGTVTPGPS